MTTAQKEASKKYDKENTRSFSIKLNYKIDGNLISWLESMKNRQGFIKQLLNKALDEKTGGFNR